MRWEGGFGMGNEVGCCGMVLFCWLGGFVTWGCVHIKELFYKGILIIGDVERWSMSGKGVDKSWGGKGCEVDMVGMEWPGKGSCRYTCGVGNLLWLV